MSATVVAYINGELALISLLAVGLGVAEFLTGPQSRTHSYSWVAMLLLRVIPWKKSKKQRCVLYVRLWTSTLEAHISNESPET